MPRKAAATDARPKPRRSNHIKEHPKPDTAEPVAQKEVAPAEDESEHPKPDTAPKPGDKQEVAPAAEGEPADDEPAAPKPKKRKAEQHPQSKKVFTNPYPLGNSRGVLTFPHGFLNCEAISSSINTRKIVVDS